MISYHTDWYTRSKSVKLWGVTTFYSKTILPMLRVYCRSHSQKLNAPPTQRGERSIFIHNIEKRSELCALNFYFVCPHSFLSIQHIIKPGRLCRFAQIRVSIYGVSSMNYGCCLICPTVWNIVIYWRHYANNPLHIRVSHECYNDSNLRQLDFSLLRIGTKKHQSSSSLGLYEWNPPVTW